MPERVSSARNDLWVFRDGRKTAAAQSLYRDLERAVAELLHGPANQPRIIDALLRAGELESALGDAGLAESRTLEQLTDALARGLCGDTSSLFTVKSLAAQVSFPGSAILSFSPAEGFAYYALHPLDFSRIPDAMLSSARRVAVIGIRSIGTTLSSIVAAALRQKGRTAHRITVRPTGHPYERVTRFREDQTAWVRRQQEAGADFLVVDEGPGRSGSSFLSAGEALVGVGVEASRIICVGSREIDPQQLCATNAVARWNAFRFVVPSCYAYERFSSDVYVGGGMWRRALRGDVAQEVACWPQMERLKFLSRDQRWLFKFEGFGRYGHEVLQRAGSLAAGGFGVAPEEASEGMIQYPYIPGKSLSRADLSCDVLDRIAEYCAFRAAEFRARQSEPQQLAEMLCFNLQHTLGVELNLRDQLRCSRPVLADGRMHPHEWIRSTNGQLIKVDGCTHGDDHFFPGPTDIAWDLAGAIVEWNLDQGAADYLVSRFQQLSGHVARQCIPAFLLAYSMFRQAYCEMAVSTVDQEHDRFLLERASRYYKNSVQDCIRRAQPGVCDSGVLAESSEERASSDDQHLPMATSRMQSA